MDNTAPAIDAKLEQAANALRSHEHAAPDRWAPWNPAEMLMRNGRRRIAATMLHRANVFPKAGDRCLEVGYGTLGWLGDLISWGLRATDLYGMEIDPIRAKKAQQALPGAHLHIGDATELPWSDGSFPLVVVSTVFTSIPHLEERYALAREITRVIAPGGALLWYDFAVNNPANQYVRKVTRGELKKLFPETEGTIRSLTLAPPLSRRIAPWSWGLATCLEAIPPLRTHLMAVLKKPASEHSSTKHGTTNEVLPKSVVSGAG